MRTKMLVLAMVVLAACTAESTTTSAPPGGDASATTSAAPMPSLGGIDPGTVLAYQSAAGAADGRVFLIRADGTDDQMIAPDLPGTTQHPDFSRDGRSLAFDQRDDETATDQVFESNGDGSEPRLLVACPPPRCFQRWEPAWSPSGDQLAISTTDGTDAGPSEFGIAIVDAATGRLTRVVSNQAMQAHYPRWSPDGERLVFWSERSASDGGIDTAVFVVNVDGTGLQRVTPWSMDAANPDWAPDRDEIVFSADSIIDPPDEEPALLFTMRPDGSAIEAVAGTGDPLGQQTQPRWTPDGASIVYSHVPLGEVSPRQFWVIDADGANDRPLLVTWDDYIHPTMRP